MDSPVDDPTPIPLSYTQTAPPPLGAPMLDASVKADVAIVGGGYTGLSAALHLAEAGASVVVLEAREIGAGGSGRAFGQVVPYAKRDHHAVLKSFGPDYGPRLIEALANGPELVFGLIEKHAIACEARKHGLLFGAHTAAAATGLEATARYWQERGAPVTFLDAGESERFIGSRYYPAALLERRGGTLNPLAYARGLARAAIGAGARLFEASRATSLSRNAPGWTVAAGRGQVAAAQIILATDAYTDDLWPGLRRSIIPLRGYSLTSARLSDNLRSTVLPGGQPLTDTRRLFSGIRLRADGRLQVSIDGPPLSNAGAPFAAQAARRLRQVFPQLGEIAWEATVAGWVGMTLDHYPHLHALAPGLWAAVGLNGRGIAFGTILGREAAKRALGRPEPEFILPVTPFRPIPAWPVARAVAGGVIAWSRLRDGAELRRGYVRPDSAPV